MTVVRIIAEVEADQGGNIWVRGITVEPVGPKKTPAVAPRATTRGDAVVRFAERLSPREREMMKLVARGRKEGARVYRKELLRALKMEELLQWNGISAWITRRWRRATGDSHANMITIRFDETRQDYEILFDDGISPNTFELLVKELGV